MPKSKMSVSELLVGALVGCFWFVVDVEKPLPPGDDRSNVWSALSKSSVEEERSGIAGHWSKRKLSSKPVPSAMFLADSCSFEPSMASNEKSMSRSLNSDITTPLSNISGVF